MKKLFSILSAITLVLSLSGCKKTNVNETSSEPTVSYDLEAELQKALKKLPDELPTLPDGSVVNQSELTTFSTEWWSPALDYVFIRYAEPIFKDTIDEPDLVDPETDKIRGDLPQKTKDPVWIKVKAGDVLENGWKVTSALTPIMSNGETAELGEALIDIEGEITLEGIFNYYNGGTAYGNKDYTYNFFPDSTKTVIPVVYYPADRDGLKIGMLVGGGRVVYDGEQFYAFQFKDDIKSELNEDMVCKATITFKNVVLGNQMSGEIVNADFDI